MRYLRCPGGVAWERACENINGLGLLSTCAAQEAEAAVATPAEATVAEAATAEATQVDRAEAAIEDAE